MKLSKARLIAITVGASVLALALIGPAFGGPSLKKLVRKEVAKQLAGKTGPQGAPGAPGPAGPTAAGVIATEDPTATPDSGPQAIATVNAPSSGRLLVIYNVSSGTADCTAGIARIGAYVDGVPVPDTEVPLQDGVASPINKSGITAAAVSSGQHTISVRVNCPSGDFNNYFTGQGGEALTGILLGG